MLTYSNSKEYNSRDCFKSSSILHCTSHYTCVPSSSILQQLRHEAAAVCQGCNEVYYDSFDPVVLVKILIPDPEIFKKIDP